MLDFVATILPGGPGGERLRCYATDLDGSIRYHVVTMGINASTLEQAIQRTIDAWRNPAPANTASERHYAEQYAYACGYRD